MGRRLLYTLVIAALGVAAFFLARPRAVEDLGLVVHVHVSDGDGRPLVNAQAERLFDPGWRVVDGEGYLRLTRVRLRADQDEPTAEAIRQAVRVRAPFYTLRHGFEPQVRERPDGSWEVRYTLHHHGVLRVHVRGTHLGPVKAYIEADAENRWEAMDQGNVARPGSPAAFRIYPGMAHVVIRTVGEPDKDGVVAVATRRHFIRPPGAGFVIEKHIVPDEVKPIIGTVLVRGPQPPSLGGIALVTELAPGGRRIPHAPVPIDEAGVFVIRTVGAGRYEVRGDLPFADAGKPVVVEGGGSVDLHADARPWAVLAHEAPRPLRRGHRVQVRSAGHEHWQVVAIWPSGRDRLAVPLPRTGSWDIRLEVGGTDEDPPASLACTVTASAIGPIEGALVTRKAPHGTVVVRTAKEAWAWARGATVTLGKRKKTLLKGLAQDATFKHVRAGPVRVRLEWNDLDAPPVEAHVVVAEGETVEVTLADEAK